MITFAHILGCALFWISGACTIIAIYNATELKWGSFAIGMGIAIFCFVFGIINVNV